MARRGRGKQFSPLVSVSQSDFTASIHTPIPAKKREKAIVYDTRLAKTVLAILGAAILALILWLDHKGY